MHFLNAFEVKSRMRMLLWVDTSGGLVCRLLILLLCAPIGERTRQFSKPSPIRELIL